MRHRLLLISAFVGSVLWASSSALAAGSNLVAINIVDAPRPQDRWGYAPGSRQVAPGTWVTWSNAGSDTHTVTATDGSFDSGELDPSQGFSWYFDTPGTYEYVCALHPWMQGTIVVGNGVGAASAVGNGVGPASSVGNGMAPAPPADDSTAPAPDDSDGSSD